MQGFLQQPESVERISLESKTGVYIHMYIYIFFKHQLSSKDSCIILHKYV